jgi:hypothetical protein
MYLWFFMLSTLRKNFPQMSQADRGSASLLWERS